jgi:hypothetical protein
VTAFRTWGKHWNEAALERIAASLSRRGQPRPWPLVGMLALGLVAGVAIGGYAISQRAQMKRLAAYARRMGDELSAIGKDEPIKPAAAARSPRSNHSRKAAVKV